MTRAELRDLIDRLKRSTSNRDVVELCLMADGMFKRLTELTKVSPPASSPVPLATKPKFNKRDFMRTYMRSYRARLKAAAGQTTNKPSS